MSKHADSARTAAVLLCVWLALALPPLRGWLESSMVLHMLVQLPLLAVIGFTLGRAFLRARPGGPANRAIAAVQSFNAGGLTGLLIAAVTMVLWMLPRCVDLARLDIAVDAIKFLTVPAAGLAIAWSWPHVPVIARAVVHLEAIATLFRFGWGYLAAEERLCLVYLSNDQQRTGEILLCLGVVYAIAIAWRPMFGRVMQEIRA